MPKIPLVPGQKHISFSSFPKLDTPETKQLKQNQENLNVTQKKSTQTTLSEPLNTSLQETETQTVIDSTLQNLEKLSPNQIKEQSSLLENLLGDTKLGKSLAQMGDKISDTFDEIDSFSDILDLSYDSLEELSNALEPLGQLLEIFNQDDTELSQGLGVSTDVIGVIKKQLSVITEIKEAVSAAKDWWDTDSNDPTIQEKREALAKEVFEVFGAKQPMELISKLGDLCEDPSIDNLSGVLKATKSLVSSTSSLNTGLSLIGGGGSLIGGVSKVVSRSVPFLGYATTAIDGAIALKAGYDFLVNDGSGTDFLKKTITAVGSGFGSTIAPLIGPLAASTLNTGIDIISSWWG